MLSPKKSNTYLGVDILDMIRLTENTRKDRTCRHATGYGGGNPRHQQCQGKMIPAWLPSNGSSNDFACCNSSTGVRVRKKVAAASKIMALLIAHPTIMENKVS